MATIYDVARAAGVSPKTVSRVLNGDAPVGRDTREAVESAMSSLGYVPSNAARMMRSNRSGLIGLITGAISLDEQERPTGLPDLIIVQGIQAELGSTDKTLMIADTGGRADAVPHLIDTFLRHRVEGLIYVADHHQKVSLPPVPDGTPVVLANCLDDAGTPAILPDDRAGMRALVTRLIAAGHRRIAYLTLFDGIIATGLRTAGYRDALDAAGIPWDPALVRAAEAMEPEAENALLSAAIDHLMALDQPPTVICTGNDKMAMKLYGILRSRGIRVPADISVAGYDNHRVIAETLYPALTTVELAYNAIGRAAARALMDSISGADRKDPGPLLIAGPVHWRDSVIDLTAATPNPGSLGGHH